MQRGNLVIGRYAGQCVEITTSDGPVTITVEEFRCPRGDTQVRLAIAAPKSLAIMRGELIGQPRRPRDRSQQPAAIAPRSSDDPAFHRTFSARRGSRVA